MGIVELNNNVATIFANLYFYGNAANEILCKQLLKIWNERRNNPSLLEQPQIQWDDNIRPCKFFGYDQNAMSINADVMICNPIARHRMLASSLEDKQRSFWNASKWK